MLKNSKEIYVVIAYRFGSNVRHSYTVGAFNKKDAAIKCAESHTDYRGGKYACAVEECMLNQFSNGNMVFTKEVYRTKSVYENKQPQDNLK